MSSKVETLTELINPVAESFGLELWGIEYNSQGKHSLLRIYVEKEEGVNVDDCAALSRQLSSVLDVEDPITGKYTLEVSSPGLDRIIFNSEQASRYLGSEVKLKLLRGIDKRRKFNGQLIKVEDNKISIKYENDEEIVVEFENIDKMNVIGKIN